MAELSRRGLLRGAAGISALSLAGCLDSINGGNGENGEDEGGAGLDPVEDRAQVDPADIQEGGTFRTAIGSGPDSFDYPYSSSAEATILMNLIYEGMITTDSTGEVYPWLAESYEQVDVQDVGPADYEEYMTAVPYAETDEGQTYIDTDAQIVVEHSDNDPSSDDEAQVLTVEEAGDAVDDGTYGMHFQFDLHDGIEFHNGEELTADNVVASYERVEGSLLAGQLFDSLLHVAADGDYTVHIYAQEPDAAAVRELGGFPVYPTESTDLPPEAMDPREGNTPLGTGAFEFEELEDEEYVVFTRNDNYWFDTEMKDWYDGDEEFPNGPVVDEVDVQFVSDPASRSAALQNDELDMTYGLNSDTLDDFQSDDAYRLAATRAAGFTFLQFPVTQEPWDDARVRRAVNQLIPRESISDEIFSGWENPAWVPVPPIASRDGTTDYDQLVEDLREYNEYDRDAATDLIEEAIDENDIDTPIEVTMETNESNTDRVRTLELIAESLNQSEYFEANVETTEFLQFLTELQSTDYYDQGRMSFIGLSGGFDPHGYAKAIHHPDNFAACCNFQNIDDDELNELLRQARYGVDVAEDVELRRERYEEVWERVLELNANSYTTHSMNVAVLQDDVEGFNTYPSTQDIIGYGLYSPMEEQITYIDD